jgi:hypothetical protein
MNGIFGYHRVQDKEAHIIQDLNLLKCPNKTTYIYRSHISGSRGDIVIWGKSFQPFDRRSVLNSYRLVFSASLYLFIIGKERSRNTIYHRRDLGSREQDTWNVAKFRYLLGKPHAILIILISVREKQGIRPVQDDL